MKGIAFKANDEEHFAWSEAAHEARMSMAEWMRSVLNEAASLGNVPTRARPVEREAPKTLSDIRNIPGLTTGDLIKPADNPFLAPPIVYAKRKEHAADGSDFIDVDDM